MQTAAPAAETCRVCHREPVAAGHDGACSIHCHRALHLPAASTVMHVPGRLPTEGVCGVAGATSAWGRDVTCVECMRAIARDPLVLLRDHGADASTTVRMYALEEARQVWARLWERGEASNIRRPERASVSIRGAA